MKSPIRFRNYIEICILLLVFACIVSSCAPSPTATVQRPDEVAPVEFTESPTNGIYLTPTTVVAPLDEGTNTQQVAEATLTPIEREIAYVVRVIDGDTIEVILNSETLSLRYIGIDSPEIGEPNSKEAAEANRQLVEGLIVELEKDVSETDQYGRLLRYVYLPDGRLVNAELVKSGFAMSMAYPPDTRYQEIFKGLEREAKENGLGLWAPQRPTPSPEGSNLAIRIVIDANCSQFNAPGNDNNNKNEEYVCFLNQGMEIIYIGGWSMRDQYGWTYSFPEFSLEPGETVKVRTGCGMDTQDDLYWCKDETAVWNNDGDCVYLINSEGEKVTEYCY